MKKKIVTLCLAAALAVTAIGGTLAYFIDDEAVQNTFTVGNVDITLDESVVNEYGVGQGGRTSEGEEYKLVPGYTYEKDPTVTVLAGSEPSYIRVFVTFNKITELKALFGNPFYPEKLVNGWDETKWECVAMDNETYEFRYHEIVDARAEDKVLEDLFTHFTLPAELTNEEVATLDGLTIDVKAEAIQAYNFENADKAWEAFEQQNSTTN